MMFRASILILILSVLTNCCYSQIVPGPFDANSFSRLNEKRTKLNTLIPQLENQLYNLDYYRDTVSIRSDINYNGILIKQYEEKLFKLNRNDTSVQRITETLNHFRQRAAQLTNDLNSSVEKTLNRIAIQRSLDSAKSVRNDVEYEINQLMIPKLSQQNFMFYASISFVVLMCILLYTFFRVVSNDEGVRKIIFGSDSGIQFVTLFSIVIAIILFGLTGVLEGKELSALLGSVAGYILGKSNIIK